MDDVVEVEGALQERRDRPLLGTRPGLDVGEVVDEQPVALVGGHPPRAGMGLAEVPLVLERRHVVAHRGRRHVDCRRDVARTHRLGGFDVLLHDRTEEFEKQVRDHVRTSYPPGLAKKVLKELDKAFKMLPALLEDMLAGYPLLVTHQDGMYEWVQRQRPTIYALEESPKQSGVLWAGSDDGLVHVTRDGGTNWKNITPRLGAAYDLFGDGKTAIKGSLGHYVGGGQGIMTMPTWAPAVSRSCPIPRAPRSIPTCWWVAASKAGST